MTKKLLEYLKELPNLRRKQGRRYKQEDMILMVIMGLMGGAKSEKGICRFIENDEKELKKGLGIKNKNLPTRNTIRGRIKNINFEELQKIFYKWAKEEIELRNGEWLSIDGKAIRGTVTNGNNSKQDFLSLVTIFVSKKKQSLLAGKINNKKESEIPKVKELIEKLGLESKIFTIDALHCQKDTTKKIIETNNDYVIGVKGNQKGLLNIIKKK